MCATRGTGDATMMPEGWRQAFAIHATTPEYRDRLAQAQATAASALHRSAMPYVAYSGGKDSTVLVSIVVALDPAVAVIHSDEGSTTRVLDEIITVARGNGASGVDVRQPLNVHTIAAEGYDLVFVGLRREESGRRRRRMDAGDQFGSIPECWPLADWTWRDVWAYLVSNNAPYLSLYDRVAPVVGYDKARYHHLFDPKIAQTGNMTTDGVFHWRDRGPR